MIEIDIAENQLIVKSSPLDLKPSESSQLTYWGFSRNSESNQYVISSLQCADILMKLVSFFEDENIPHSLTARSKHIIDTCVESVRNFEQVKTSASSFKDGNINESTFQEFTAFLRHQIHRRLKDHQIKAAYHLYIVGNGANFSVPGSGKTSVVLSVYEKLRQEGRVNLLFVVGPPSCFGPWRAEFELTLGRIPKCKMLAGIKQSQRKLEYYAASNDIAELYLTTYQTLLNDQNEVSAFFMQQGMNVFLVIDEAHYIKQLNGNWASAVLRVSASAINRCVLTGTPLPRSYTDLFNPFDFLWPQNSPIDEETKMKIKLDEENGDEIAAKQKLMASIGSLFYRVRKSDLGLKAPVFHPPHVVLMNKYERLIYDAIVQKIRSYAKEDYLKNIDLVNKLRRGRMIRLRQCVSYAKLLSSAVENYDEDLLGNETDLHSVIINYDKLELPSKIKELKSLVGSILAMNQKVLIWANFINTLKLIKQCLFDEGFTCKLIYGAIPTESDNLKDEETREEIIEEFINPSTLNILIANPAACAESISLHKTCYHAIYYDLSYNCAQYLQSLDRIHRVGGSEINEANYYFLQYDNTIDQDIKFNLDAKAKRMYEVVEEDYNINSLDMFDDNDEIKAYERLFDSQ